MFAHSCVMLAGMDDGVCAWRWHVGQREIESEREKADLGIGWRMIGVQARLIAGPESCAGRPKKCEQKVDDNILSLVLLSGNPVLCNSLA